MQKNKQKGKKNKPMWVYVYISIFLAFSKLFGPGGKRNQAGGYSPKEGEGIWGAPSGGGGKGGTGSWSGAVWGENRGVCSLWLPARHSRRLQNMQLDPPRGIVSPPAPPPSSPSSHCPLSPSCPWVGGTHPRVCLALEGDRMGPQGSPGTFGGWKSVAVGQPVLPKVPIGPHMSHKGPHRSHHGQASR